MNKKIYKHFSSTVSDYDTTADRVVQKNEELQEILVDSVGIDKNKRIKVLDIGCGTGHGMSLVLREYPNSFVVGIDFSDVMIQKANKNLSNFKNRIKLIRGDFIKEEFGRGFDVVLSGITIHNVTHKEKTLLFKKIFDALAEKGLFVNGDFIEGETTLVNNEYKRVYETYLRRNLNGNELDVWLHRAFKEDKPMKLSQQFKFLKKIGFKTAELIWQFNNQAAYIARK